MDRNKLDPGPTLAEVLRGDDFNLEKAVSDNLARQKWGKDSPWYLSEERVGDIPYRYQGLALHGGLAALGLGLTLTGNPGGPIIAASQIPFLANTLLGGRTQRPKIGEEGVPVLKDQPY